MLALFNMPDTILACITNLLASSEADKQIKSLWNEQERLRKHWSVVVSGYYTQLSSRPHSSLAIEVGNVALGSQS